MKHRCMKEAVRKERHQQDLLGFRKNDISAAVDHINGYHEQQNVL